MSNVRPQLKVLIVDDSELNREMLGSMLGDEYEIVEAENGAQAVDILRENASNLSLVLLDIQMPQKDGIETLREMRAMPDRADIPVIMLTGVEDKEVVLKSAKLGICDYLLKPFTSAELLKRLRRAFAQEEQEAEA